MTDPKARTTVRVTLDRDDFDLLVEQAGDEDRSLTEQARHLLKNMLRIRKSGKDRPTG